MDLLSIAAAIAGAFLVLVTAAYLLAVFQERQRSRAQF
jgi:hypothetical protein